MSIRCLTLVIFLLASVAGLAVAAAPDGAAAKTASASSKPAGTVARDPARGNPPMSAAKAGRLRIKTGPSLVAPLRESGGRMALTIEYRWQVHENVSIEVRLVPGQREEGTTVLPVYFVGEYLKGPVREKAHRCLDRAGDVASIETVRKDKMEFRIVGERNSLGRPALHVLPYNEGGTPEERPGAVFLELADWAVNDRMLILDMPREVFGQSGKLFVWLLRDEKIIWEERIYWPGSGSAK